MKIKSWTGNEVETASLDNKPVDCRVCKHYNPPHYGRDDHYPAFCSGGTCTNGSKFVASEPVRLY